MASGRSSHRSSTRAGGRSESETRRPRFAQGADGSGSASGSDGFRYGRRNTRLEDEDERVVRRYYPIFENLVLFVLNSRRWLNNFRKYIREETRYRVRLLLRGTIFLALSLTFLFGSGLMVVLGAFFVFYELTGSAWAAGFLNAAFALLVGIVLLLVSMAAFRGIGEFERRQEEEQGSASRRRRRAAALREEDED